MKTQDITQLIDHTLLSPDATTMDVVALVEEATELGTYSICVSPSMLPIQLPEGSTLKVAAVCGFPSGKHSTLVKVTEAREAIDHGADEIDMVVDIGAIHAQRFDLVEEQIAAVRAVIPSPGVLKVIIESAALDQEEIVLACRAATSAGADFVKTSTGLHPTGGATVEAVRLMSETVRPALGVKASGGIRTAEDAEGMIAAGASRLGVSGTRALLQGAEYDDISFRATVNHDGGGDLVEY